MSEKVAFTPPGPVGSSVLRVLTRYRLLPWAPMVYNPTVFARYKIGLCKVHAWGSREYYVRQDVFGIYLRW